MYDGGARAYTIDHVNSLSDEGATVGTVFTGDPFGPCVLPGAGDILAQYAAFAFLWAGYQNILLVDSRYYHNGYGDVRCGTNAKRAIPTYNWWEK